MPASHPGSGRPLDLAASQRIAGHEAIDTHGA